MSWESKVWDVVRGRTRMARRNVGDVRIIVGEKEFLRQASARGFHVVRVGEQFVVFLDKIEVKC